MFYHFRSITNSYHVARVYLEDFMENEYCYKCLNLNENTTTFNVNPRNHKTSPKVFLSTPSHSLTESINLIQSINQPINQPTNQSIKNILSQQDCDINKHEQYRLIILDHLPY